MAGKRPCLASCALARAGWQRSDHASLTVAKVGSINVLLATEGAMLTVENVRGTDRGKGTVLWGPVLIRNKFATVGSVVQLAAARES